MRRFVVAALLALLLVGGLVWRAAAQVEPLKHHACHAGGSQTLRSWYYLPDGNDPCPSGWVKVDWIDD